MEGRGQRWSHGDGGDEDEEGAGEAGIVAQVVHRDDGGWKDGPTHHRHLPRLLRYVVEPRFIHLLTMFPTYSNMTIHHKIVSLVEKWSNVRRISPGLNLNRH